MVVAAPGGFCDHTEDTQTSGYKVMPRLHCCYGGSLLVLSLALVACGESAPTPATPPTTAAPATVTAVSEMPSGRYGLDTTHGYITFTYSHLGFSNPHVGFTDFDVALDLDAANPSSSTLTVVVKTASVYSRVAEFDEHLQAEELFDATNYPEITFTASSLDLSGSDLSIDGLLTIKGIETPVTLTGRVNKAGKHPLAGVPTLGVSATGTVKRSDWGLTLAVPAVSDEVRIDIEVELPFVAEE